MPKIEIPEKLLCPITHELFKEPVIAEDGHTYEKAAITEWVSKHGTSPLTCEKITAKFIPALEKNKQLSKFFEEAKLCSETQFFAAVKNGNVGQVTQLNYLASHLEARDKDIYDYTPLHWAASKGHASVVKLLLDKGANIEAKDKADFTPLYEATWTGHVSIVKLLLAEKANIKAKTNAGHNPLHVAASNGYVHIVKLLLAEKANIETKDNEGNTPLHLAARKGHDNMIKLLLEKGANYKAVNHAGQTPADFATKNGRLETASLIHHHQKLMNEAKQVPAEIAELRQTIQQQEQRIEQQEQRLQQQAQLIAQLQQQLQRVLSHFNLDQADQSPTNTASPAFFK